MRKIFFIIIFSFSLSLNAQWSQTNGPLGETDNNLRAFDSYFAVLHNTIFYGTNTGLHISKDNGNKWVNNNFLPKSEVNGIKIYKNDIYVYFDNYELYKSSDTGISWKNISNNLPKDKINGIEIFDNEILVFYENLGLYYSPNNNEYLFKRIFVPKESIFSSTTSITGINKINGKIYVACIEDLITSSDTGRSWKSIYSNLPKCPENVMVPRIFEIDEIFAIDSILLIKSSYSEHPEYYYSVDDGKIWNPFKTPILKNDTNPISNYVYVNKKFVCVTLSGLFEFDVKENKCQLISNEISKNVFNDSLSKLYLSIELVKSGNNLLVLTDYGFYISTNMGANWSKIKIGINKEDFYHSSPTIYTHNEYLLFKHYNGLYFSENCGVNWREITIGWANTNVTSLGVCKNLIIAGCDHNIVYSSKDKGVNWYKVDTGFESNSYSPIKNIFSINDQLYIKTYQKLFSSNVRNDSINSFSEADVDSFDYNFDSLTYDESKEFSFYWAEGIFKANRYKNNYKLHSYNKRWNILKENFANIDVASVHFGHKNIIIGSSSGIYISNFKKANWKRALKFQYGINAFAQLDSVIFAVTNQGIFKSIDDGLNWFPSNNGLSKDTSFFPNLTQEITSMTSYKKILFISTRDYIFMSSDYGKSWINISEGLYGSIQSLTVDDEYIYAGTSTFGVIRRSLNEILKMQ